MMMRGLMMRGLGHSSVPFLFAALAALALYRILETGLGWSPHAILTLALGGAAITALVFGLAYIALRPRQP